ncbi:MAG: hypothetical protein KJZ79_13330 [Bryobacteraceae bacterium]|nr:hypothetical protein [Bryobacteraceae bacterium]
MNRRYRSEPLAAIHEAVEAVHAAGMLDEGAMERKLVPPACARGLKWFSLLVLWMEGGVVVDGFEVAGFDGDAPGDFHAEFQRRMAGWP